MLKQIEYNVDLYWIVVKNNNKLMQKGMFGFLEFNPLSWVDRARLFELQTVMTDIDLSSS